MFQMCFVCCPICGKMEIVFVEVTDGIVPSVVDFPCEECYSEPTGTVARIVDDVFKELGISVEDENNG